jgi:methylated-DNA-protein-cysteine methyltransferase-like protein
MNDLELPPDERNAFYATVWKIARQIPAGRVYTYGQIAALIPTPEGITPDDYKTYRARWAGSAMAAYPPDVPWQRVINAQGKIPRRQLEMDMATIRNAHWNNTPEGCVGP